MTEQKRFIKLGDFIYLANRVANGYPIFRLLRSIDPQKTRSETNFRFRFINRFESGI